MEAKGVKNFGLYKIQWPGSALKCWLVTYEEVFNNGAISPTSKEFDTLTKAKNFRKEERTKYKYEEK